MTKWKPFLQTNWDQAGFEKQTAIQEKAIPLIMEGNDIIAESPTGTGKTLAYLLPIIQLIDAEKKGAQRLILAPSHELVMQIFTEIQKWTKGSEIGSAAFIGGANIKRQLEKLKKRPQIIVGTPGRILELIKLKKLKMHEVKTIVLDECDQLLVLEHYMSLNEIIKSTLNDRQLLFFSATALENEEQTARDFGIKPVSIHVSDQEQPSNAAHVYIVCEQREKIKLLERFVKAQSLKGLAFFKDIGSMTVAAAKLQFEGISLNMLHSDLKKQERAESLKKFRSGKRELLLATDIAARGLDIAELSHVFHVDFPKDLKQYVHRSGRTGRMGAEGFVVAFVTPREERTLKQFAKELGISMKKQVFYKGTLMDEESSKKTIRKGGKKWGTDRH